MSRPKTKQTANTNFAGGRKTRKRARTPISDVCLYVGNLPDTYGAGELEREFSKFGRLRDSFISHRDGKHRGFGFVEFESPADARRAVTAMNGMSVGCFSTNNDARPMRVVFANERTPRGQKCRLPRHKRLELTIESLMGIAADVKSSGRSEEKYHAEAFEAYKSFRNHFYDPQSGGSTPNRPIGSFALVQESSPFARYSEHFLKRLSSEISHACLDPKLHAKLYAKLSRELVKRGALVRRGKLLSLSGTVALLDGLQVQGFYATNILMVFRLSMGVVKRSMMQYLRVLVSIQCLMIDSGRPWHHLNPLN